MTFDIADIIDNSDKVSSHLIAHKLYEIMRFDIGQFLVLQFEKAINFVFRFEINSSSDMNIEIEIGC